MSTRMRPNECDQRSIADLPGRCGMIQSIMLSFLPKRFQGAKLEDVPQVLAATAAAAIVDSLPEFEESTILKSLGWISAGLGAVALGLFVGRELRSRYKFNRRTPYDFYAHSGDEMTDMEFGVGI